MRRDMGVVIAAVTPDALARLMEIGGDTWFNYFSYEMRPANQDGTDHLVEVDYATDLDGPFVLRYRFREIEGEWKVVDVERAA